MNNVLYIDKPLKMTSFDLCFKLRKVLNTKKIGHTGTLDPNASGVMIVLFDKATKINQFLVSDTKTYQTRVLFGVQTDTLDLDGNIILRQDYICPSKDQINDVLNSFKGKSKQVVPITSAVKINGKKLYEYQRENKEVELPIRDIEVFDIKLLDIYEDGFSFETQVSSGTYIRSLVRDILAKLEIIGTVKTLKRTKIDDISIKDCDKLEEVLKGNYKLHNELDLLSKRYKSIEVENLNDIKNGKRMKFDLKEDKILIVNNNEAIAIYQKVNNEYQMLRGLW